MLTEDSKTTGRARWAGIAAFGLVLAAAAPLLMLAGGILWGLDVGDELPFFGITAIVGLAGAALMRSRGTWRKVVAIVAGLAVAAMLFWTAFGLAAPGSFFDFVPGLLVMPGVLLAVVTGIAAIRAERRGDTLEAPGRERTTIRAIAGVVVALAAVSAVLTLTGQETVGDDVAVDGTTELSDFEFDRDGYTVDGGATILVRNKDPFLHTFTVDALGIDVTLSPGSEKVVTIPDRAGTYILYCEPHTGSPEDPADDDMAATLEVS